MKQFLSSSQFVLLFTIHSWVVDTKSPRFCRRAFARKWLLLTIVAIQGLCLLNSGVVMASPFSITSGDMGFPIEPIAMYSFLLQGLPGSVSDGVITISETNGDFNNPDETVTVTFNALALGTHTFALDNEPLIRTLTLDLPISESDLSAATADGSIVVNLTTSSAVDPSWHTL